MVMMRPPSRRKGTAARTAATTPPTFTANSRSSAARSAVWSLTVPAANTPSFIDEDVESAELLGYRLDKVFDLLGVGLVCFERCGVNAFALEVLGDGRRFVGGSGIADGDVSALIGELLSDGRADTARSASDERHLAGERLRLGGLEILGGEWLRHDQLL